MCSQVARELLLERQPERRGHVPLIEPGHTFGSISDKIGGVVLGGRTPLSWFIVVSIGVIILRVREPDLPRGFKVPLYPVTPVLSVLACGYILYSLPWYTWLAFSGWVAVVLVFYFVWGRHHSALNDPVTV